MKRVLVIGCPGSGKSTFARKLQQKTKLPLYYLDMLWHKSDKTNVTREEFDESLAEILNRDEWIIDGNYSRTMDARLQKCDTVFLFDLPTEVCISGVEARIGTKREDMPWVEQEFDPEFKQFILDFKTERLPRLYELLNANPDKKIHIFKSRISADEFIANA